MFALGLALAGSSPALADGYECRGQEPASIRHVIVRVSRNPLTNSARGSYRGTVMMVSPSGATTLHEYPYLVLKPSNSITGAIEFSNAAPVLSTRGLFQLMVDSNGVSASGSGYPGSLFAPAAVRGTIKVLCR